MLQIDSFKLSHTRNDEFFGFLVRVNDMAAEMLKQTVDEPVVAALNKAVTDFDAALKQDTKNSRTAEVAAADEVVDHLYTGLTLNIRSLTYHPYEPIRKEAEKVLGIIDKYGKLTTLPYNQQYGALQNSMQELTALPDETITLLQMAEWLEALDDAVLVFRNARAKQTEEQGQYQVGLVKEARTAADEAYRQFVASVNAFAIAFGEANYAEFITRMNVMIADVQAELKARKTRAENAKKKEKESTNR